ncbi:WXG100 family type VII secretion target [Mycobacterium sp. D16Q16]|uniref:WXG100 family type VII secretion target n=1 Tax=Mycobacterium sp. D16Q16 TaxID=1855659 RepID=UPI0009942040|nr:WXG100 family type VII secretion target [Mycobacterium sp. D16Q16]
MVVPGSGSGDVLYLQYAGVIGSAKDIDDANTAIKTLFDRLKTEGDEVVGGSWTGSAASKLDEGWQQWQEGIHKLVLALDQATSWAAAAATSLHEASERLT